MGILNQLFGPSANEAWEPFAATIGGEFTAGSWLTSPRIDLIRDATITTLDTYTVSSGKSSTRYTRMRMLFFNPHSLHLHIYCRTLFSNLGLLLGMQRLRTGTDFDRDFIVQGRPEETVLAVLASTDLRSLIMRQPLCDLSIKLHSGWFSPYSAGMTELHFQCAGTITDSGRLKWLFELFRLLSDRLTDLDPECDFRTGTKPV